MSSPFVQRSGRVPSGAQVPVVRDRESRQLRLRLLRQEVLKNVLLENKCCFIALNVPKFISRPPLYEP
jgi:hypothetical protein